MSYDCFMLYYSISYFPFFLSFVSSLLLFSLSFFLPSFFSFPFFLISLFPSPIPLFHFLPPSLSPLFSNSSANVVDQG